MFNNINDNNFLQLDSASNVVNIANIRSAIKKHGYNTNPYVDKTEISSDAMKLFQRDLDIKKFAKIASENPEDLSYMEKMQELFSEGVTDPFEDDVLPELAKNSKLWQDIKS